MKNEIILKEGFGPLRFGMQINSVIDLIGKPSEVEEIGEDLEMPATVLYYEEKGLSLFFENLDQEKLSCINIETEEIFLFEQQIKNKTSKEIVELMRENKIFEQTMDKEEWGEERISYEEYAIDFFFLDDKLNSVTIGL
ncbi:MAG: hypothetical protein IKV46_00350 [Bacteroidales bacterium]|jgi:hypothetical protein|nr:hypothetical protein [Bacteroidales bacterium]